MSAVPAHREPAALTDIAEAVRTEHAAAEAAFQSAVGHALRAGELLIDAKAQVPHGGWAGWLVENFPASDRTARGYMRLAAHAEEVDRQGLADLGIEGALKQLAEPKVSDDVAHRRVQHVDAEDDLRDGLRDGIRAWADAPSDDVDIAFTAVRITYNQLEQAGAHTDFGYQDFDAYVADRLGDVEAEFAEFQRDNTLAGITLAEFSRSGRRFDLIDHVQAVLSDATEAAAELVSGSWETLDEEQRNELLIEVVLPRYGATTADGIDLGASWWAERIGASAKEIERRIEHIRQPQDEQVDEPPAGLDHLARAEWFIDRADAKVAAAASDLLAWADEAPEHLSGLNTAARRYAHLLLAQPEPWGELSDAKEWARQEFAAALDQAADQEARA